MNILRSKVRKNFWIFFHYVIIAYILSLKKEMGTIASSDYENLLRKAQDDASTPHIYKVDMRIKSRKVNGNTPSSR